MTEITCSEDWNEELGWKVVSYFTYNDGTPIFRIMDRTGKAYSVHTDCQKAKAKLLDAYQTGNRVGLFFHGSERCCNFPYCNGCKQIRGYGTGWCCGNKESDLFGCMCYNGVVLDGFMARW